MHNIKVLYVDDESINNQLFLLNFKNNCQLVTATSGKAALKLMESSAVDILITDYKMPEMNGLDLISSTKQLYPTIKCYLVSAYLESEIRQITSGIDALDGIISKPWNRQQILDLIEAAK